VLAELAAGRAGTGAAGQAYGIGMTVDAEEADRLELSLDMIGAGIRDPSLKPAGTASAWRCRPTRSARRS
jgi:RHH-type proline utilization regulon transcriptional repressor/proline dehydrogenase/delta 1-pyrroline-5-carboxylate dehydrogenase